METDRVKRWMVTAHEALGRFIADETGGESDLANILAFAHHFIRGAKEDGFDMRDEEVPAEPVLSFHARSGPAYDPNAPPILRPLGVVSPSESIMPTWLERKARVGEAIAACNTATQATLLAMNEYAVVCAKDGIASETALRARVKLHDAVETEREVVRKYFELLDVALKKTAAATAS